MKRASLGIINNQNPSASVDIDPQATVRTQSVQEPKNQNAFLPVIDLSECQNSTELNLHDKKEAEIYQMMAQTHPNRHIHLVDQKTEEQKKIEAEYKLKKTYDRISLPDVIKRRQKIGFSPHTKVQLSKA